MTEVEKMLIALTRLSFDYWKKTFSALDFYMAVSNLDAKKLLTTVQRGNKRPNNISGNGLELELNWFADR